MTRRGYNTVYEACRVHKVVSYGGKRRTCPGLYYSERVIALVAERVMRGDRIDDAWRKEMDRAVYRDRQDALKRNPR